MEWKEDSGQYFELERVYNYFKGRPFGLQQYSAFFLRQDENVNFYMNSDFQHQQQT